MNKANYSEEVIKYILGKFEEVIKRNISYMPQGRWLVKKEESNKNYKARENYRVERFHEGLNIIELIENHYFKLRKKYILDIACGFGGQICSFLTKEVCAVGIDFINYKFQELQTNLNEQRNNSSIAFVIGDMKDLPFSKNSFDVIYSNAAIEHLSENELNRFLVNVKGLLKRHGIFFLSTPVAFQGIKNDPHYALPLVSIFPPNLKKFVSEGVFKRGYPWNVQQTFISFSILNRKFKKCGMVGESILNPKSRKALFLKRMPFKKIFEKPFKEFYWDYIVLKKSKNSH